MCVCVCVLKIDKILKIQIKKIFLKMSLITKKYWFNSLWKLKSPIVLTKKWPILLNKKDNVTRYRRRKICVL